VCCSKPRPVAKPVLALHRDNLAIDRRRSKRVWRMGCPTIHYRYQLLRSILFCLSHRQSYSFRIFSCALQISKSIRASMCAGAQNREMSPNGIGQYQSSNRGRLRRRSIPVHTGRDLAGLPAQTIGWCDIDRLEKHDAL
jgi:hypothetical protein